jgi:hypothetical protein
MSVDKICGLLSTTLTAPEMLHLYQAPNLVPLLTIPGEFTTSNPNCPVIENRLLTSADEFDLVDNTDQDTLTYDF